MKYFNVIQGSDDWYDLRKGVPTASNFDRIITPAKAKLSKGADKYIAELIGEKFSRYGPERVESYTSNAVRHGQETEDEARRYLALTLGLDVSNGGFCLTDCGRFGASPDGLIDFDGTKALGSLELKCPQHTAHTEYLLDGGLPLAYRCQVHGQLIVTGAKFVQFLSYHDGLPPHLVKVAPDSFTDQMRVALELFWDRYQSALSRVKSM